MPGLGGRLERGAQGFTYLASSETFELAGVDDGEDFRTTLDAMAIIGLSEEDRDAVMRIVAAVLHLGNMGFQAGSQDDAALDGPASRDTLHIVAQLLQVRLCKTLHAGRCMCDCVHIPLPARMIC